MSKTLPPDDKSRNGNGRSGRCIDCRYELRGLTNHVCPECGRRFDWDDPGSFLSTDHYVWIVFWLPAILFSGVIVFASTLFTLFFFYDDVSGLVFGLIAVPGCLYAYARRVPIYFFVVLGFILLGILATAYFMPSDQGVIGALAVVTYVLLPYCFGVIVGCLLRMTLKRIPFAMRAHLPAIAGLLLLTGIYRISPVQASFAHLC